MQNRIRCIVRLAFALILSGTGFCVSGQEREPGQERSRESIQELSGERSQKPSQAREPGIISKPLALTESAASFSLELIHQWEPVTDTWSEEEEALILGLQANLWTEFIRSNDYYEYMLFPRLSALAEIAWSPKGDKDLDDFIRRLDVQFRRYEAMGINYRVHGEWPSDFTYLIN